MAYQEPLEGKRTNIKSNSNSVIDNCTVTLQQGTLIGLSQSSTTITVSRTPEYLEAYMNNNQTADLGAGDHVKFNTVISSSGSNISLDTTTAYTNGAGASRGRFTLAANHTYWLFGDLTAVVFNGNDLVYYYWYNVTGSAQIGATVYNTASARNNTSQSLLQAPAVGHIATGGSSTLVELRILPVSGTITRIGDTLVSPVAYGAVATVRMIG